VPVRAPAATDKTGRHANRLFGAASAQKTRRAVTIKLNDKTFQVAEGASLASFIESVGLTPRGIAVAIEGRVVPKSQWGDTILTEAMELMLIHAVSGG
jgi:sulfur carrier protein